MLLSCIMIWLLTFPAMPSCSELPSMENVNAPKWLLINYSGECFTAATLANTSSGSSRLCFLSAHYIRWLVPRHKHLQEEGRGGRQRNVNILRSVSEGVLLLSCSFFSIFFVGAEVFQGVLVTRAWVWWQFFDKRHFQKNTVKCCLCNALCIYCYYTQFSEIRFLMAWMFLERKTHFLSLFF